jgi:Zn-dependent M16 (insulinase) family peptidase
MDSMNSHIYSFVAFLLCRNALNEAKAFQMHPQQSMKNYIYKSLFNQHSYAKNELGELNDIVILTRGEMVDFYERHYHPSNGVAFCYGPQEYVDECMNLMDPVLNEYEYDEAIRAATKVGWQELEKINSNLDRIPYPSYQDAIDFRLARAWVLNDQPMDLRTEVAWFLIEELLVGSPAASLSRLVVDLELGDDVIGSLEYSLQQWVLILGVSGVPTEEKIDTARQAFDDQLIGHAENGFADNALNAALNKIDMRVSRWIGCSILFLCCIFKSANLLLSSRCAAP